MTDICRICGRPLVNDALVESYDSWEGEEKDNPTTLPGDEVCWRRYTQHCTEDKDDVEYLLEQRDKLIEENKQLQLRLSTILGESLYVPKPSEMDRLEEAKAYVRGINALRRKSRPPI
jgi:hypothetical protein